MSEKLYKLVKQGKYTAQDRPQGDEFKNFDREALIALIEAQKERIGELLADKDIPQTKAVVKPYKPTNREILDAIENSDCPWK